LARRNAKSVTGCKLPDVVDEEVDEVSGRPEAIPGTVGSAGVSGGPIDDHVVAGAALDGIETALDEVATALARMT